MKKKAVKKYAPGGETPYQKYLKNPKTDPSDTIVKVYPGGYKDGKIFGFSAKDPKNAKKLSKAMEETRNLRGKYNKGGEAITKGTGRTTAGVQMYGPSYKGNPNSPKPFVGTSPAKKKGGAVKAKKKK